MRALVLALHGALALACTQILVPSPTGELVVAKEDTLNAGEVSRDLVADVCVAALFDSKSTNKVVEIIEGDGSPKLPESKWFA